MDNLYYKRELNAEQMTLLQSEFEKSKKSKTVMYLLWLFVGGIGGHRYYLGNIVMGIFMTLTLGGLGIWALIDVFFIGKRLEQLNDEIEYKIIEKVKTVKPVTSGNEFVPSI